MSEIINKPKPEAGESEDDFVSRCIAMRQTEHPDESPEQSAAACYSIYEQHNAEAVGTDKTQEYKTFSAEIKAPTEPSYDFLATITTIDVDRDTDVVLPDGVNLKNYLQNPVVLWAHDHSIPCVGKCVDITRVGNALTAKAVLAKRPEGHEGAWLPDILKSLMDQGMMRGISIGFVPLERRMATKKDKEVFGQTCTQVISKSELLEFSLCNVPSNQNSLVYGLNKCIKDGLATPEWIQKAFGIEVKGTVDVVGDEKTYPECMALDGQELPEDPTPVHPNCRCTWNPDTKIFTASKECIQTPSEPVELKESQEKAIPEPPVGPPQIPAITEQDIKNIVKIEFEKARGRFFL